jgi:SAM-dependent methyltransferase
MSEDRQPTTRFSGRSEAYRRGRPSYPVAAVDVVIERLGVGDGARVVDLGSGTGIFSALLLARGLRVDAVEPNADMRAIADDELGGRDGFRSIAAPAEATGLADASADAAVAAQAFHWFDAAAVKAELLRILRPPAPVVLLWNARDRAVPLAASFEDVLARHGRNVDRVGHHGPERLRRVAGFFSPRHDAVRHVQHADWETILAFLGSASYLPAPGGPGHDALVVEARAWFDAHADDGAVEMPFVTDIYSGTLR